MNASENSILCAAPSSRFVEELKILMCFYEARESVESMALPYSSMKARLEPLAAQE